MAERLDLSPYDNLEVEMWKDVRSSHTSRAALDLARLIISGYPDAPRWVIYNIAYRLRPASVFNGRLYRLVFLFEYERLRSVNMLTLEPETEKEKILMGKISQAAQNAETTQQQIPFVKPSQLYELGVQFCIRAIRKFPSKYGEQWTLTLIIDEETAGQVECTEDRMVLVNFAVDPTRRSRRDTTFELLATDLPAHCGMFNATPTSKGHPYITLGEHEGICSCGEYIETAETDTSDPFLPDFPDEPETPTPAKPAPVKPAQRR